jgi:hypothetical protein
VDHAGEFGWSWELQSEPWHLRYVAGDEVPAAVIEFEEDDEMLCIDYRPGGPEWVALVTTGTEVGHIWNGHADAVYRAGKVRRVTVDRDTLVSLLRTWRAVGPCPFAGDHPWSDPSLAELWEVNR